MEIGTLSTSSSKMLFLVLLVLAGVFSGMHTASAQMHEPCPLSPGVVSPADPRITAQQVENGSANLMDFALIARDHFKRVSAGKFTASVPLRMSYPAGGGSLAFRFHLLGAD